MGCTFPFFCLIFHGWRFWIWNDYADSNSFEEWRFFHLHWWRNFKGMLRSNGIETDPHNRVTIFFLNFATAKTQARNAWLFLLFVPFTNSFPFFCQIWNELADERKWAQLNAWGRRFHPFSCFFAVSRSQWIAVHSHWALSLRVECKQIKHKHRMESIPFRNEACTCAPLTYLLTINE